MLVAMQDTFGRALLVYIKLQIPPFDPDLHHITHGPKSCTFSIQYVYSTIIIIIKSQ